MRSVNESLPPWKHILALVSLLTILAILLALQKPTPLEAYQNHDSLVFINHAERLASDWTTLGSTQDPLLRYVPIAAAYTLFNPPFNPETIGYYVTGLFANILFPVALWMLVSTIYDYLSAHLAVIAVIANRVVGYTRPGILWGTWQYEFVLPFVFTGFLFAFLAINSEQQRRRLQYAVGTGIALGLAGLQQLSLTGTAVFIVGLSYLTARRFRELTLTSAVGAIFATGFLFQSSAVSNHVTRFFGENGTPEAASVIGAVTRLLSPGNAIFVCALAIAVAFWYHNGRNLGLLEIGVAVTAALKLVGVVFLIPYLAWFSLHLAYPLLSSYVIISALKVFRPDLSETAAHNILG